MGLHTNVVVILALLCGVACGAEPLPNVVPDKAETRGKIDALIGEFQQEKKKATLGMIQEAIELSISYGAPAWNEGDHGACCDFYSKTATSLVSAFGKNATPSGAAALTDLSNAIARTKGSTDVDRNAWALRFAFDMTQVACDSEAVHASGLIELGTQYMHRTEFDEAGDAYAGAVGLLGEMDGRDNEKIPPAMRLAPIVSANALLGQKKFHEAAAAAERGLALFPEWAQQDVDLRTAFGDPVVYGELLGELRAAARQSPKDAELHFLLGYELYFGGQKDEGTKVLRETLTLDPKHAGAKRLLEPEKSEPKSEGKSGLSA